MKLNRKHIPYFAAIVQTSQFGLAGYFLIGVMGWFFLGIMGALVSFSLAYGASQFSDIAQGRKRSSFVTMVLLMSFSPILVGTATWLHLVSIPNPYWRGVVSLVWGMLPDLAVALSGFIAGKGLVEQGNLASKPKKIAGKAKKPARKTQQLARKHVADNQLLAYLQANPGASQQKVADHFGVTRQAIGPRVKKLYEVKQ